MYKLITFESENVAAFSDFFHMPSVIQKESDRANSCYLAVFSYGS